MVRKHPGNEPGVLPGDSISTRTAEGRRGPQIRKIAWKDHYPVEGAEEKPRKSSLPKIVAFISRPKTGADSLFQRMSRPETGRGHTANFHVIY
tara:strand:- start:318 stop:596 length:279 start_codon:yes stop_codon:yes gene_type:complete